MQRLLELEICDEKDGTFFILIRDHSQSGKITFNPENKELSFLEDNALLRFLKKNEYQFRKILHIKNPESYASGVKLSFVITDKKDVAAFNDLNNIVALNRLKGKYEIKVRKTGLKNLTELYTDGSFHYKKMKGGFAVIIKSVKGEYTLKTYESEAKSSSLIELQAAIKGLELTAHLKKVRIVTDSQYVRKGLTEWIMNWKRNNWMTASGTRVKNIDYWKFFESLSENRYIEFQHVKAHSQQFENTMADLYAKDMAGK